MSKKNGMVVDEDGDKAWYKDGELHRDDGPAIVCANGETGTSTDNYTE
jgi:hypothetical protein